MSHTIKDIKQLPTVKQLIHICRSLALLDAILMTDWEYRYFSFNCLWNEDDGEMMASLRDGSGSEYFILISQKGAVGKVFDPSIISDSDSAIKAIPDAFKSFVSEPAFSLENVSYCFWREVQDDTWNVAPNGLNEFPLLKFLTVDAVYYHEWAQEYYEQEIDLEALKSVYNSLELDEDMLQKLNPEIELDDLDEDLEEILGKL
ncbi:hypothetical protein A7985_25230 [Pseudoalteromonas luteoviolacea]|uniref:Uncharacterized protein n=1 Tax=Pseudoalteromonas luteoviolacea TaxID=43657 RepID=A0A1C0TJ61_9GAMM|nr:hypothetical protein [Pseudoalteromonas luteoviolacea]OCQ17907.1 hypothetical protein A7985_25230 [Pseudoalteromonas luteoviolacea]